MSRSLPAASCRLLSPSTMWRPTVDQPGDMGSLVPRKATWWAGAHVALNTEPSTDAICFGSSLLGREGRLQSWEYSISAASLRRSAMNAIRLPSGDQQAPPTSYVGAVSLAGLPPSTSTTHALVNSSR